MSRIPVISSEKPVDYCTCPEDESLPASAECVNHGSTPQAKLWQIEQELKAILAKVQALREAMNNQQPVQPE